MSPRTRATIDDLYRVPENGKAELINFAAGTLVVWEVDVVRVYRASDPERPTIYRSGDVAEAEPALPGWSMPVDDLLP